MTIHETVPRISLRLIIVVCSTRLNIRVTGLEIMTVNACGVAETIMDCQPPDTLPLVGECIRIPNEQGCNGTLTTTRGLFLLRTLDMTVFEPRKKD